VFRGTIGDEQSTAAWLSRLTAAEPDAATTKVLRTAAAATPPRVALESYESWTTLRFADEAATIVTPTLVLAPELDKPMTPEFAREKVADLIEGSRLEVIAQTGHYAIVERPADIAASIGRFLEEL
jgi:pimeloyl-ACP methyl ester carboxylesterase